MAFNFIIIVIALSIALLWALTNMKGRGAYSSLLAMLAVIAAGAVSLGMWQFFTLDLLRSFASDGGFLENIMWGAGLLLPFIVTLGVLRLVLDTTLRGNLKLGGAFDFAGGLACGLVSAVITSGIIAMGLGMMRTGPAIFGHQAITDDGGQIIYANDLWLPVDKLTVRFYEYLSNGALATPTPLARTIPDFHEHAASVRFTPTSTDADVGRIALSADDVNAISAFTLEGPIRAILTDINAPNQPQQAVDANGDPYPEGSTIWGITLRFTPGAAEKGGQIVVTPPQLRLIIENDQTGDTDAVYPVAITTRTDQRSGDSLADYPYHRFRIDANGLRFATVGADATHHYVPEFVVKPGFSPKTLFVKGLPLDVSEIEGTPVGQLMFDAASAAEIRDLEDTLEEMPPFAPRDLGILSGLLLRALDIPVPQELDWLNLTAAEATLPPEDAGLRRNNRLPGRWVLTNNTAGALQINDDNLIVGGTSQFDANTLRQTAQRNLRIDAFFQPPTTTMIVLELANIGGDYTPTGDAFTPSSPDEIPILVGENGQEFTPVGFAYSDGTTSTISLTPTEPLAGFAELPDQLSRAKQGQSLWFLYRVTTGVSIVAITSELRGDSATIDAVIAVDPPLDTVRRR